MAKARATAGALQLLRLLAHPVVVKASQDPETSVGILGEAFVYHTRGDLPSDQPAGFPVMHSILDLVAAVGTDPSVLQTPEVYDATVFAIQLLFVLCGTQLYQPFQSSFESSSPRHYVLEEIFRRAADGDGDASIDDNNLRSLWTSKTSVSAGSHAARSPSKRNGGSAGADRGHPKGGKQRTWTPRGVLETCLEWQVRRPGAPERSIARFYHVLARSVVAARGGERPGPDGMYESYMVVQATAPAPNADGGGDGTPNDGSPPSPSAKTTRTGHALGPRRPSSGDHHSIIFDATMGVLTLSGSIIMLPFRLMSLVIGVLAANRKGPHGATEAAMMKRFGPGALGATGRTRDVLWLSDSILADLGCSLLLLLANSNRKGENSNPFRVQLRGLTDNRWEHPDGGGLPDLPNFTGVDNQESFKIEDLGNVEVQEQHHIQSLSGSSVVGDNPLMLNFESLFIAFGRTVHTEVGALFLYTLIQSSPSFADSLVVRSDLDTLVMPLLRTLYFGTRSHAYMARDYASKKSSASSRDTYFDIRSCPFRSQSQLYVIIILLLLFSQDPSFGRDAFRRITVSGVVWYKERHLKSINLGSIMILTLLRSLLFNLSRLHDAFLLSNCCAVLMNLSPSVVDLHEYASMRLAAVTVSVMKRHLKLATNASSGASNHRSGDSADDGTSSGQAEGNNNHGAGGAGEGGDDDDSSPVAMHREVSRALLGLIRHCLSPQNVEQNSHLIYALVYHQADLIRLCRSTASGPGGKQRPLYPPRQTERIQGVTLKASALIQREGARSAPLALRVLQTQMAELKEAAAAADARVSSRSPSRRRPRQDDGDVGTNGAASSAPSPPVEEEFTFTYEEEADPEIFFLPYVWEVIVCVVTSGTMDWKKDEIRAFALLEEVDNDDEGGAESSSATGGAEATVSAVAAAPSGAGGYTKEADELV